ncbi:MAG: potassium/proton antiporter [Eubacteriales bacterium]|nr:potassium/proton antiporter [Eubacteriales bacterium]
MTFTLLLAAAVLIACLLCQKLSDRIGIPTLLAFIGIGMVFGSDGILRIPFDNYQFAEQVSTIALIFIMFYGGFGTKWSEAKPAAAKAVLLSTCGVVLTALITGLFCFYVLRMPLWEGMLIGSVLGSTDAASVFSILRSKRLNLKYNTASLLEVESGSNDPFAYMMTMIVISLMTGEEGVSVSSVLTLLFSQILFGIVFGVAIAWAAVFVLKKIKLSPGMDDVFVVAVALFAYALPATLGGNGFLSVYLVGIIMGNQEIGDKKSLVHFFDGVTGIMQMMLFFLLGLLSYPSRLPAVFLMSLAIALFLTFVARPAAVFALLSPFRSKVRQMALVSWAGLRGAASIVFAVLAVINVPTLESDLFHMVFLVVLFSILLQGSLLPVVSRKLKMIGAHDNVLRTFNDYSETTPVQFIQCTIPRRHAWAGKRVRDIVLPPDTIFVLVQRTLSRAGAEAAVNQESGVKAPNLLVAGSHLKKVTENIAPKGHTVLMPGDIVTLSAKQPENVDGIPLREIVLTPRDGRAGRTVAEASADHPDKLIVMIERGRRVIIPRGSTKLLPGDRLVIHEEAR